ncbi:nitroreductase/quinone reductase family protein [Segniliparus rugosus]|uniref:Deazaflavin-dependent nitroreductase n=1 Tax=Segniliparus rugosus (strain ATCC BAA-974 / DSM 45345 / CCUG 50838 / CIP 108380 / JCM 13579 / CDC 945) TaxID=679197 RepID=E5XUY7_SEGRC|nr:nitroreductase/quinone reductase family protein [Segniliparus rugosus]EFV11823.1 deazaflavin-dependent nitroreductase [Segniliparus rugosus ATCC BAA-974]
MQLETTPADRHERSDYLGPAVLVTNNRQFPVEVELRGFFQPIDGSYRWHGWVRADEASSAAIGPNKQLCSVRTEHGESAAKLDEADPWGRRRLLGTGAPPFPVVTSLEDADLAAQASLAALGKTETHPSRLSRGKTMPFDAYFKLANHGHRVLLKLTGGLIGRSIIGVPIVELTTTGRKSGQSHTVLLNSPVQNGKNWLVVASKGGSSTHPAWYLNLTANPNVLINRPGKTPQKAKATVVNGEERERLWPRVVKNFRQYGSYAKRTSREIPLVWIEPIG